MMAEAKTHHLPTRQVDLMASTRRWTGRAGQLALWALPLLGFLLTWQILVMAGVFNRVVIPPPTRVAQAVWEFFATGTIWPHMIDSLQRAVTGFGISILLGLPLGILIGWFKVFDRIVGPVLEVFRQLPPLALFPVMIVLFGLGLRAQVAIVVWASLWPILLNTISGTREVDRTLIKAAKSLGASEFKMFTKVVLPSAVPVISTGLRLGGAYALLVLVAAEMIGANSGLGFLILRSQYNFRIPDMYAAIVILALVGLAVNYLLIAFERRMTRWRQRMS